VKGKNSKVSTILTEKKCVIFANKTLNTVNVSSTDHSFGKK